jgi:flagellar biosynthesis protein FlhA
MLTNRFIPTRQVHSIILDAKLEQLLIDSTRQAEGGTYLAIDPVQLNAIYSNLKQLAERVRDNGFIPIVMTSAMVRRQFRKISEQLDVTVLSFTEIDSDVELIQEGIVRL